MKLKNTASLLMEVILIVTFLLAGCTHQLVPQSSYKDYAEQIRDDQARIESMLESMQVGEKEQIEPEIKHLIQELISPDTLGSVRAARNLAIKKDQARRWACPFLLMALKRSIYVDPYGTKYYEYSPSQTPPWKLTYEVKSNFEYPFENGRIGVDSSHHLFFLSYYAIDHRSGGNYYVPAGFLRPPVLPSFTTNRLGFNWEDFYIKAKIPKDLEEIIQSLFLTNPPSELTFKDGYSISIDTVAGITGQGTGLETLGFFIEIRYGPPQSLHAAETILALGKSTVNALVFPLRYEDYIKETKEKLALMGMSPDPWIDKNVLSVKGWRGHNEGVISSINPLPTLPCLLEYLINCLKNDSPEIRKWAAWNLGRLDMQYAKNEMEKEYSQQLKDLEDKAVERLSQLLRDENADVRDTVNEALKKIIGKDFGEK